MRSRLTVFIFLIYNIFFSTTAITKEMWVLDKDLSTISFEIPVFLLKNVQGEFSQIEGLVEIDIEKKENNKAIFSVDIHSVEMNYKKYKSLLLSNVFFSAEQFPIALVDTKKFSYENENKLRIMVELSIKGITQQVPLQLEVMRLAEELIQLKSKLIFSRTSFQIGTGQWSSTAILKDKVLIKTNLFLFKN